MKSFLSIESIEIYQTEINEVWSLKLRALSNSWLTVQGSQHSFPCRTHCRSSPITFVASANKQESQPAVADKMNFCLKGIHSAMKRCSTWTMTRHGLSWMNVTKTKNIDLCIFNASKFKWMICISLSIRFGCFSVPFAGVLSLRVGNIFTRQ